MVMDQGYLFGPNFLDKFVGKHILYEPRVAILELIANAWDAGAKTVQVTWPTTENESHFSIEDDGEGLTEEEFIYKRHAQREFPTEKVLKSLRGVDAKAWITESDIPDADEIHINYGPWVAKAKASTKGPVVDQAARAGASVGVLAPVGTHIEIKGGWLTPPGDEWRDSKKALRAQEIRDYGFT